MKISEFPFLAAISVLFYGFTSEVNNDSIGSSIYGE